MFPRVLRRSTKATRLHYDQHYQSLADQFRIIARERPSQSLVTEILLELRREETAKATVQGALEAQRTKEVSQTSS
jgi:hypothetical protein